ncbi:LysR family transcriptional regulator [Ligilactobacillus animalis]|jgi:DNA-binding transcriptional LysR family regulator|uniref:LysR family transcriptional regulator n=1 Tax=Ligilactobacillus animalis TaxID=1605 RepID=UPI002592FFCB|nr:LysR family transcriptional regulator [Ligilactobacillus animalis]
MNLKQIDYALEAAKTLNFNQAAQNLFISQPALSYQIKELENEIGFLIFERQGKSIKLTAAGRQFCQRLTNIKRQLTEAIEQGQNFATRYAENITIGYPRRSCLQFLPTAINEFAQTHPETLVTPEIAENYLDDFSAHHLDIAFALKEDALKLPQVTIHPLFTSRIYLLTTADDPLAQKELVKASDLTGRTLLVKGGSTQRLRKVQQDVLRQLPLATLNSPNHDFTMVTVAAKQAVCLSPGYLNTFTDELVWLPFETTERFECVLVTHENDQRRSTKAFVALMQELYAQKAQTYPL